MVASEQEKGQRVLDFAGHQQADRLQWLFAAVYVVSEEQVVVAGRFAKSLKDVEQVRVLPIDVAADVQRRH